MNVVPLPVHRHAGPAISKMPTRVRSSSTKLVTCAFDMQVKLLRVLGRWPYLPHWRQQQRFRSMSASFRATHQKIDKAIPRRPFSRRPVFPPGRRRPASSGPRPAGTEDIPGSSIAHFPKGPQTGLDRSATLIQTALQRLDPCMTGQAMFANCAMSIERAGVSCLAAKRSTHLVSTSCLARR